MRTLTKGRFIYVIKDLFNLGILGASVIISSLMSIYWSPRDMFTKLPNSHPLERSGRSILYTSMLD